MPIDQSLADHLNKNPEALASMNKLMLGVRAHKFEIERVEMAQKLAFERTGMSPAQIKRMADLEQREKTNPEDFIQAPTNNHSLIGQMSGAPTSPMAEELDRS